MCGDSHLPAAPESGDLVAIIHPNPTSTFRGRLELSNRLPGATSSSLQCSGSDDGELCNSDGGMMLRVRIHKFGQPLSPCTFLDSDSESEDDEACSNPILHSFLINAATGASSSGVRFNLGVGGEGIVGRTVSIFDSRRGKVLGEGVIGWS